MASRKISKESLLKVRKDAVNDFKKEMICTTIQLEFKCFGCKNLPRPSYQEMQDLFKNILWHLWKLEVDLNYALMVDSGMQMRLFH